MRKRPRLANTGAGTGFVMRRPRLGEPVPTGNVVAKAKERRRAANEVCEWMEERFVAGAIGEFAFGAMVTVIKEQQVAPSIVSPAKRQVFADELKLGKFVEE
eukprot:jgi/Tetstr1/439231/TSEL_027673.t1